MHEFDTPRPIRLNARFGVGEITMTGADVTKTTIDIQPVKPGDERAAEAIARTTVEQHGDQITLHSPDRGGFLRRPAKLRITVTAPRDSSVESRVALATVTTHGRLRDVRVKSASGDTEVEFASGEVHVDCASGNVRVDRVDGRLRYNGASGDLDIGECGGVVSANCVSGSVRIGALRDSARVIAVSGNVDIDRAYGGDVSVQAASGDITVGVPAGVGVFVDANAMSGRAESELPVSDRPVEGDRPALTLRLRAMSGDVRVVRAPGRPQDEKVYAESPTGSPTEIRLEK